MELSVVQKTDSPSTSDLSRDTQGSRERGSSCTSSLVGALWADLDPSEKRLTCELSSQLARASWILLVRRAISLFSIRHLRIELKAVQSKIRRVRRLIWLWYLRMLLEHNLSAITDGAQSLEATIWGLSQEMLESIVLDTKWKRVSGRVMASERTKMPLILRQIATRWQQASARCKAVSEEHQKHLPVPVFYQQPEINIAPCTNSGQCSEVRSSAASPRPEIGTPYSSRPGTPTLFLRDASGDEGSAVRLLPLHLPLASRDNSTPSTARSAGMDTATPRSDSCSDTDHSVYTFNSTPRSPLETPNFTPRFTPLQPEDRARGKFLSKLHDYKAPQAPVVQRQARRARDKFLSAAALVSVSRELTDPPKSPKSTFVPPAPRAKGTKEEREMVRQAILNGEWIGE